MLKDNGYDLVLQWLAERLYLLTDTTCPTDEAVPMKEATKNINLNVRMPPRLHAHLVKQARQNNRSLNGEIVDQLERRSGLPAEGAERAQSEFRPRLRGLLEVLAAVMEVAGGSRLQFESLYAGDGGPDWLDDRNAFETAAAAANHALSALRPEWPNTFSGNAETLAASNRREGQRAAQAILNRIAIGEPASSSSARRTELLRKRLGPLVERIKPTDETSGFAAVEIAPRRTTNDEHDE